MHSYDELTARIAALVFDYTDDRLRLNPVPLDSGTPRDELPAALDRLLSRQGNDPAEVMRIYADIVAPTVVSCDSPRYLAFIPAAPTKASLLFDMVVSAASLQGISWLEAAGAIHAENTVLRLLADAAGLPAGAGGTFVSGGSAGNLSALVVARDTARRRAAGGGVRPRRVAVSDQAHSSIASALNILGVEALRIPTVDDRLTEQALLATLADDPQRGDVFAVVATSGTTNAGIIDDLEGVGSVANDLDLWFHVDGAYGGAGLLAPSVRDRYRGMARADSFIVDPHKWLFSPFDCAALIYRQPELARVVHTQHASYLDPIHEATDWNPTDYAYHLTRRALGLPLWFSLAVHGTDAYAAAIEKAIELARTTARLIDAADHVELLREPELSVVLFRRHGWTEADYHAWSERLLADQTAFVTPTTWHGETVARLVFLHPDTTVDLVEELLATMR